MLGHFRLKCTRVSHLRISGNFTTSAQLPDPLKLRLFVQWNIRQTSTCCCPCMVPTQFAHFQRKNWILRTTKSSQTKTVSVPMHRVSSFSLCSTPFWPLPNKRSKGRHCSFFQSELTSLKQVGERLVQDSDVTRSFWRDRHGGSRNKIVRTLTLQNNVRRGHM